jgi:hypothetical protein
MKRSTAIEVSNLAGYMLLEFCENLSKRMKIKGRINTMAQLERATSGQDHNFYFKQEDLESFLFLRKQRQMIADLVCDSITEEDVKHADPS